MVQVLVNGCLWRINCLLVLRLLNSIYHVQRFRITDELNGEWQRSNGSVRIYYSNVSLNSIR